MKWNHALWLLLLVWTACDNDLEPYEDPKDIPVIYGILNAADTAHYIRVERAFLPGDRSALEVAQDPNALYYENVKVTLTREATGSTYDFVRVDGNQEGYVRKEGTFANAPNYLYKLILPAGEMLDTGEKYTVTADRLNGEPPATATTTLLPKTSFTSPIDPRPFPSTRDDIAMSSQTDRRISFATIPNALYYDLYVVFDYEEETSPGSGDYVVKTFRNRIVTGLEPDGGSAISYRYPGQNFYIALSQALEAGPARKLLGNQYLGFEAVAIGSEVGTYLEVLQANVGLTSAEILPIYTNVENGLGILTSTSNTEYKFFRLSADAINYLRTSDLTGNLGF